jgi:hypothetical protein
MMPLQFSSLGSGNLVYHGGPIQKNPTVYLVYWGWGSSGDPADEATTLNGFLADMGGSKWLKTVTQYDDSTSGDILSRHNQLLGTWSDPSTVPPNPSDSDLATEALNAAAHFGYSADADYIIALPSGVVPSGFGTSYCAWHGVVQGSSGPIAFTNFPYIPGAGFACGANSVNPGPTGLLDGVPIVLGHEVAETQTDPLLNAWFDAAGYEIGDKCAWIGLANLKYGNATYPVQPLYSNAASNCVLTYRSL